MMEAIRFLFVLRRRALTFFFFGEGKEESKLIELYDYEFEELN